MMFGASIDWCEMNYLHSDYIAEYWNTLTGIFLCIVSVIVYRENKQKYHFQLYYSNLLLFVVGIGTILFHGTLLYPFQLLDEIPMLLIAFEYYKLLNNLPNINPKLEYIFINITNNDNIRIIVLGIITSYFVKPSFQVIAFQGSLAIFICLIFYNCIYINKNLNKKFYNKYIKLNIKQNRKSQTDYTSKVIRQGMFSSLDISYNLKDITNTFINKEQEQKDFYIKYREKKQSLKMYNKIGISLFVFSFFIWKLENMYCDKVQFFQLHAWWHITTSIGMYFCNKIMSTYIELESIIS